MTPAQRLNAAKTEIARRRSLCLAATDGPWHTTSDPLGEHVENGDGRGRIVFGAEDRPEHNDRSNNAHIAANDPRHVHEVLEIHQLLLDQVDDWLLNRLGRGGLLSELVSALLDLYAPLNALQEA